MAPRVVATEFGIRLYVNPDVIAQGLAGFDPASAGIRAGRIMHQRLEELREERQSFAVESTISGRSLQRVIQKLNASGYTTLLIYLWLPEPDLAVGRVRKRVRLVVITYRRRTSAGGSTAASSTSIGCTGESPVSGGCTMR
jgi:predicted ABC-type ATPase